VSPATADRSTEPGSPQSYRPTADTATPSRPTRHPSTSPTPQARHRATLPAPRSAVPGPAEPPQHE
jgi:hypothetical protein